MNGFEWLVGKNVVDRLSDEEKAWLSERLDEIREELITESDGRRG